MKQIITIPTGWHRVPLGDPVKYHDLIWGNCDPKYKSRNGWMHVEQFGDSCKKNTKKHTIRQDDIQGDLMMALRHFPYTTYSMDRAWKKEQLVAYILYLAGAKEINTCVRYLAGEKKLENILLSEAAFTVKPYIELPMTEGTNLLWYLLRKLDIPYSGGASPDGESHMQATWVDKEGFIPRLIAYFNAMKKEFGDQ